MVRQCEAETVYVARLLPLAALGLWIAMLWVPVFASPQPRASSSQSLPDSPQPPLDSPQPARIIVTVLDGPGFDLKSAHSDTLSDTLLVGLGVVACARDSASAGESQCPMGPAAAECRGGRARADDVGADL